ncbi:hypothetical protein G7Y79_00002g008320 [Physcia stellaris]|nr:hypothetical protein G7Y79_00002g008320 [Physcia stellaris]
MSSSGRSQSLLSSSSSGLDYHFPVIDHKKPVVGFLSRVEVPAVTRYIGGTKPAPVTIGSSIHQLITTTALSPRRRLDNETAKILGRVGIERLGRFQIGEIVYQLELTNEHHESRIEEVDYDSVLNYVSLPELERFENQQFEQELVYEDPLPVHVKRRGRPTKVALQVVGLSSEEEPEPSSIPNDGIAISVPESESLKRRGSSSPIRGRGRAKRCKTEHVHSRLSSRDSSQLVAAGRPIEDKDLGELQQKLPTQKRGPGRPRKHTFPVQSSENDELSMLQAQFEVRKLDKPKQWALPTSKTASQESSASEDELGSLHQRFGIITRKVSSSLGDPDSPRSSKVIKSRSHSNASAKPSPRNRPGYNAPTQNHHSAQDLRLDASAFSESSISSPADPERRSIEMQAKAPTQDLIEISSDETNSSSQAASSTLRSPIKPNASLTSRSRDLPSAANIHDDVESVEQANDQEVEKSSTESDVDDEDDEVAAIADLEIPEISSSQSFRVSVSTSSSGSDFSGEQRIRAREVSKTKRLAGNITVPPRRGSISMQNVSREAARQSRVAIIMEARKQRDGDNKGILQKTTAPTGPEQQTVQAESSKKYRFPGNSTDQVAAKSRAEMEARKREQAAKATLIESGDSSSDGSNSDSSSGSPDPPPARKAVSSTHAARTQQQKAPIEVKKQNQANSFPLAFKQLAAAHQQQQEKQQQPSLPARKPPAITGPFAQSNRKSHNESQSRPQAKHRSQPTPSRNRSKSPLIPAHRESSISLGETPPHRSRIAIATKTREPSIDLEEPRPRPTTISFKAAPIKPIDHSNKQSRPSDGSAKADKKKKKSHRVSMTPLFPSAAWKESPVKKGRVPFSTREFEGEV